MSEAGTAERTGWLGRLKAGLKRSSASLGDGITAIFTRAKLDPAALSELEELLIRSDLGTAIAARIVGDIAKTRFEREITPAEVRAALADSLAAILAPVARPLLTIPAKPYVILVVGVNGTGKTTTIGKLAKRFHDQGLRAVMAAGDTFRAAAIEQLRIWGERTGAQVIAREVGADPASLAFDAYKTARDGGSDVLLIDTAGRLQNKADLMAELAKVVRVLRKIDPALPHSVLLVLDATTGQNALAQVEIFRAIANVTGLVVTKLDGTARGGVLVAIVERFGLPVHFIGVGESADDLQPFDAKAFARALCGAGA